MGPMIAVSSLALVATLAYIGYYEKNKSTKTINFPKKTIVSILLTSVVMLIGSASLSENSFSEKLAVVEAENSTLLADLKTQKELNKELEDKVVSLEDKQQQISYEHLKTQETITSLENKVSSLTEENTALQEANDKLTKKNNEVTNNVAASSTSSNKTTTATSASGGSEYFQNCTHLRGTYPAGVGQDHPAYQPKMDRDKDGWACE